MNETKHYKHKIHQLIHGDFIENYSDIDGKF